MEIVVSEFGRLSPEHPGYYKQMISCKTIHVYFAIYAYVNLQVSRTSGAPTRLATNPSRLACYYVFVHQLIDILSGIEFDSSTILSYIILAKCHKF